MFERYFQKITGLFRNSLTLISIGLKMMCDRTSRAMMAGGL